MRLRKSWLSVGVGVALAISGGSWSAIALEALGVQQAAGPKADGSSTVTPQFYARWSLLGAKAIVPADALRLAARQISCLHLPTVLNPYLPDYGEAFQSFIVLNPKKLATVAPAVQYYIYAHECGHVQLGPNEAQADCFSMQKGVREGWLEPPGVDQICGFIRSARPDARHLAGPERCQAMRACYAAARAGTERSHGRLPTLR